MLVARSKLGTDLGVGLLLWGVPLLLVGLWPDAWVAFAAFALVGVGNTIVDVAGDTLLQRAVPDAVLARAFAAMESVTLVAVALGSVAAPVLIDLIGDRATLIVVGALLPVAALLAWRPLAALNRVAAPPELELLSRVPLFAPLPPATLEYLAEKLSKRRVRAGEPVFRAGEHGDRFYVIVDGTVQVSPKDAQASELGSGDFFGEIALLRDVPRTADVVAKTDVDLLELQRDDFVAAVTGHAEASRAADSIVGARLGLSPA
jgi:MFS family permease